jgi:hypothetical protein
MKLVFTLHPVRLTRALFCIVLFLLLAGLASIYIHFGLEHQSGFGLVRLFDLDGEYNLPAIYSSLAIWFSAVLLWLIYCHARKHGSAEAPYWKVLSLIFVCLGIDELASIHEILGRLAPAIWKLLPWLSHSRRWIYPVLPLLGVFALYFWPFYRRLPHWVRLHFSIAGLVYVGGAIGIEFMGAWFADLKHLPGLYRSLFSVIEEGLEMIGIVLFNRALLFYIQANLPKSAIELRVHEPAENDIKAGMLIRATVKKMLQNEKKDPVT